MNFPSLLPKEKAPFTFPSFRKVFSKTTLRNCLLQHTEQTLKNEAILVDV